MQGFKQRTAKLFYEFSLSDLVPADHIYRRIEQHLDLRFLYSETSSLYGTEGQQSIDPVVFMKMCLLGYFNNITSDRGLQRYCVDSLSARWFLGYDIDEDLPVHSTLSRTRALFGSDLYEQVFCQVLALCIESGLVGGKRQAFDSVLIKANASLDSLERKVVMEDASQFCQDVIAENDDPVATVTQPEPSEGTEAADAAPLRAVEPASESEKSAKRPKRSNKTHASSSDPDARMMRKPGKPTQLYYHGQVSVDSRHGVITGAMADYADREDHMSMEELLTRVLTNLNPHNLTISEILADSKYNTSSTIEACELEHITAYMGNPSGYKAEREGFEFDPEANAYRCSQGVMLTHRGTTKARRFTEERYAASAKDCAKCPLRSQCLTGKQKAKRLSHRTGKAFYDLMHERLQSSYGQWMLAKRKGIVEPAIGTLIEHNGMRKSYARGITSAHKHVLLSSISFNLKKWLRYGAPKQCKKPAIMALNTLKEAYQASFAYSVSYFGHPTIKAA